MKEEPVFQVDAPVEFSGPGTSGEGVIVEISQRGARVRTPAHRIEPDAPVSLAFRFFETSNPFRVPAKVLEPAQDGFAAEFAGLQSVQRHMIRLMMGKLQERTDSNLSNQALLREPR